MIENPAHYVAGRVIEITYLIEDWSLGWHLGNVMKYISRAGRKGDACDDLKKARWYLERKIAAIAELGDDDPCPRDHASIDAAEVIADWTLPAHLAGVVSVLYHRRTLDVPMLREALSFIDQRLHALEG